MKAAEDLTTEELRQVVAVVQEVLWLDMDSDSRWVFNPDKTWTPDHLQRIADELQQLGLRPETMIPMASGQTTFDLEDA